MQSGSEELIELTKGGSEETVKVRILQAPVAHVLRGNAALRPPTFSQRQNPAEQRLVDFALQS